MAFTCCACRSSRRASDWCPLHRRPPVRPFTPTCAVIRDTSSPKASRFRSPGYSSGEKEFVMQLASKRIHSGRVIDLDTDTVRFPDGSTGELEMVRHPGAAAGGPFASDPRGGDPTILLIQQFWHAGNGPLIGIPPRRLNPRGDPPGRGRRELLEGGGVKTGRPGGPTTIWN